MDVMKNNTNQSETKMTSKRTPDPLISYLKAHVLSPAQNSFMDGLDEIQARMDREADRLERQTEAALARAEANGWTGTEYKVEPKGKRYQLLRSYVTTRGEIKWEKLMSAPDRKRCEAARDMRTN